MLERYIAGNIKKAVCTAAESCNLEEIRLRSGRPVVFNVGGRKLFIKSNGEFTGDFTHAVYTEKKDIEDTLSLITSSSVYAYKEDMARGFITLPEGHRAGLCGECVSEGGHPGYIRRVTGINLRIAKEIKGCSEEIVSHISEHNVLVIAPPGCGKTTLLRDMARALSQMGNNVCIADERSEIAPVYAGKYLFDIGINTDVLSGCDKVCAMELLLRSMNPDVIVTDELTREDVPAVRDIMNSGVKLVASFHGKGTEDFFNRISEISFDVYVVLDKNKSICKVVRRGI